MAEDKKAVILYVDIISTFETLEDDEAGRLIKHYLRYVNDLNPEPPDRITQIAFEPIKQQLKRDLQKWERERTQRSDAGKKGMEKRWHNKEQKLITKHNTVISDITPVTNITDNVNVSVTVTDKETIALSAREFDLFWAVYPKKKSKGDAEKVWKTIKPTRELTQQIITAVQNLSRSQSWIKDNGQFIPYPATWLRAKGWEDEIETTVDKSKLTITPEQRHKLMTE